MNCKCHPDTHARVYFGPRTICGSCNQPEWVQHNSNGMIYRATMHDPRCLTVTAVS